jgi:hypothetical protein
LIRVERREAARGIEQLRVGERQRLPLFPCRGARRTSQASAIDPKKPDGLRRSSHSHFPVIKATTHVAIRARRLSIMELPRLRALAPIAAL